MFPSPTWGLAFPRTASKQEKTQELQTALVEGQRLGTVLRLAVKQHYGISAEKLTEFGLQPFRGRSRKAREEPEPPPPVELSAIQPAPGESAL
jgi:hypothetical protein